MFLRGPQMRSGTNSEAGGEGDMAEKLAPLEGEYNWWTRKTRMRCVVCGKIAYPSQEVAREAVRRISEREPMRYYRGKACGHFHVSRKFPRRAPA